MDERKPSPKRTIVELDPDHPGFRDPEYRRRRDEIARIAIDYTPGDPVPRVPYTETEHGVWHTVREKLLPLHEKHACREYREHFDLLGLPDDHIPQLRDVSRRTTELGGFRLEPVHGLVSPAEFLSVLADRTFLATQYIRHHSAPLYTPEPDVVHEILGHAVTFTSPVFAEMNRVIGRAVKRTTSEEGIEFLARVFWFTMEFGVVMEDGEPKAYGAGLLSSAGEIAQMQDADLQPMDFRVMGMTEYDVTTYQPVLFTAPSWDVLVAEIHRFHDSWNDEITDTI